MRNRWLMISAVLLCGCYDYLPAPRTVPLAGRRIQVTLTDEGSAALAPQVGPSAEALGGTLLSDSEGSYVISVRTVRNRAGWETGWKGEEVRVPQRVVMRLEQRRLSKTRTTIGSIALVAALVAAQKAFGGPGGANVAGPSPGGPGGSR